MLQINKIKDHWCNFAFILIAKRAEKVQRERLQGNQTGCGNPRIIREIQRIAHSWTTIIGAPLRHQTPIVC
jgi:hypothetical protein